MLCVHIDQKAYLLRNVRWYCVPARANLNAVVSYEANTRENDHFLVSIKVGIRMLHPSTQSTMLLHLPATEIHRNSTCRWTEFDGCAIVSVRIGGDQEQGDREVFL